VARALLILPLLLLAPALGPAAVPDSRPDFRDVDGAVRAAVESGDIPGAVIVVGRGDDVLLHRAWGARRVLPDPAPMTADTIFDIASLTKPLGTTLAVMALVERGTLALDAPLGRYVKEFDTAAHAQITLRRVLTHTAGFPATPPNPTVQGGFPGAAQALARLPLEYPPGSAFQYTDTGFILLGEVVRRVSGQPLDRFLERNFWKPLALRETSFRPAAALRPRIAPTEWAEGRLLWGEVHDPRARLLGGVAGHAGMFSTAGDLARLCRMLVNEGALDGTRVLRATTIRTMWQRSPDGNGTRALGWDMSSVFARIMSPFFPTDSVGHTGFTGTAVWIDPASRAWMLMLTNRVHPSGGGAARISELRTRVAAAVGAALFQSPLPLDTGGASPAADAPVEAPVPRPGGVRSGLDVLVGQGFASISGHAVGLVTNQTGIDARGRRGADLLNAAPNVRLQAIFSPEHGLGGDLNADVPHGRDAATGKPVWSLYGPTRRPTPAMLKDVTLLVFDVQDVGVRYYTYLTTLVYVMEEAARQSIPLVVLDRPNPITGRVVEGPLMDPDLGSFTAPHTIPVRTGMTMGEFARMVAAERRIPVALTVIAMEGWERSIWYDDTGLPWVNPSPNIRSVTQALLYSGIGLLEATNLSVGRGTDRPFEVVGAPWMDGPAVAAALQALRLPGVGFEPVTFTPSGDRYARTPCSGVRIRVTDREAIRPVTIALALARELRARHRDQWRPESVQNLLVNRSTMWAFLRGEPLDRLLIWAEKERSIFLNRRASYLIYR